MNSLCKYCLLGCCTLNGHTCDYYPFGEDDCPSYKDYADEEEKEDKDND